MRQNALLQCPIRHETNIAGAAAGPPEVIEMSTNSTNAVRYFVTSLLVLLGLGFGAGEGGAAGETRTPVAIQFSLDRPIDSGAAPFVLARRDWRSISISPADRWMASAASPRGPATLRWSTSIN